MDVSRPSAVRRWCLTLNNYTDADYERLLVKAKKLSSYFILGKETGESGTPHIQGFICLKERLRLTQLKMSLSSKAHFEPTKGSIKSNIEYCSKEKNFVEFGSIPNGRGKSSEDSSHKGKDYYGEQFNKFINEDKSDGLYKFAEEYPGQFFYHGPTMLMAYHLKQPDIKRDTICVEWVYGPPGSGKSRYANDKYPKAYMKDSNTKWWHGYLYQEEAIIEDLAPNFIHINHLLKWFDRYRCRVETKGGMIPLHVLKFIVTSNYHPAEVYPDSGIQLQALLRRIKLINYPFPMV